MRAISTDWWRRAFDEDYHWLYPIFLGPEDAEKQVTFFILATSLSPGARVLDLGCGSGRHAIRLAHRGYQVTGVDYSHSLLDRATQHHNLTLINADIRKFTAHEPYDAITSFSTSFGYFSDTDNRELLTTIYTLLKPSGFFFLDINNPPSLVRDKKQTTANINGVLVTTTHFVSMGRIARWKLYRTWEKDGAQHHLDSSIQLYSKLEIDDLLTSVGFNVSKMYGSYDGDALTETTKRLLVVASKP